tara:strand:- start:450 stop:1505 length:1056 start_codon:yes stop_codon:yes gene_type:complete
MSEKEKILVLNIATDSKDTSLGFSISWLNEFSKNYQEVDVITLNKGDTSSLNKNINIYEINKNNSKFFAVSNFYKTINLLTKRNNYEYCFSHMSAIMILASYPILLMRNLTSIFWYTHAGPKNLFNKLILLKATLCASKIITASENSYPLKSKKLTPIGHAIDYKTFYKKIDSFTKKDFAIVSRISKSKNIEESLEGFLNSNASESSSILIIGGPLTDEDIDYYEYLLNTYKEHKNVSFIGPVPHSELVNYLKNVSFHINNTDKGFYDKSVLETSVNGIINFYKNIDYDKNIPINYQEVLRFDGSSSDLSNKISSVFQLNQDEFLKIIEHSQKQINNESLVSLVKRIEKVI